ncbi:unnamed protein product, partial [Mesorhabditis spiculigera]
MSLNCGHSLCERCVNGTGEQEISVCPICRTDITAKVPNFALLGALDEVSEALRSAPASEKFLIFARTIEGKLIALDDLNENTTILTVKQRLCARTGHSTADQLLMFNGNRLMEDRSLRQSMINKHDTIEMKSRRLVTGTNRSAPPFREIFASASHRHVLEEEEEAEGGELAAVLEELRSLFNIIDDNANSVRQSLRSSRNSRPGQNEECAIS